MKDKDTPSFDSLDQDDLTPVQRLRDHDSTETIDIKGLFGEDLTTSGSFNFGDVSETPLGKLLQVLPIMALLVDGTLNVVFMNSATSRMVPGWDNAQGSKPFREMFPDGSVAETATSLIGQVLATRKPMTFEAVLGSDTNRKWGRLSYRTLRVCGERLVLVLAEDLTHEKLQIQLVENREKELKDAYGGLERQLRQAQKMEAVGTLAGGIAHDFNNILTIISGFAELAYQSQAEGSQAQSDIQQVLRASERAAELVKQILTFSRQGEHEKISVSITPIVKETIKFLRSSLPSTIDINHKIDPALGKVLADPTQVQQVLMNLCTNAGHAMREKGGQLSIRLDTIQLVEADLLLDPEMSPGQHLRLTVSDTGHGISAEILDRIFDPYFTTKKIGEGTGLGLAVVHGIVKRHGGTIRVQSHVGQGSSFEVFFPFAEGVDMPEEPKHSGLPTGLERVLFVDDEEAVAQLGERILVSLGYRVTTRTDSLEALELFRSDPDQFDLVMTDMTMPKATGRDLAMQILRMRPNIPVVLCTGYSDQINEDQARALGIREVMKKPFSRTRMAHIVRDVLDGLEGCLSNDGS